MERRQFSAVPLKVCVCENEIFITQTQVFTAQEAPTGRVFAGNLFPSSPCLLKTVKWVSPAGD